MSKRRKPLKDLSLKHLKRVAIEETQHEVDLILESAESNCSSIDDFVGPIRDSQENVDSQFKNDRVIPCSQIDHPNNTGSNIDPTDHSHTLESQPSQLQNSPRLSFSSLSNSPLSCSLSSFPNSPLSTASLPFDSFPSENDDLPTHLIESENLNTTESDQSLKEGLACWSIRNQVPNKTLSDLLKLLKSHGHTDLPSDARTLLNTPRYTEIRDVFPGKYWHAGIRANINSETPIGENISGVENLRHIEIAVGFDGLPIAKSSGSCLWPIMGRVVNAPGKNIFLIGAYHGYEKPNNANDYMKDFVDEMLDIFENGIIIKTTVYSIKIKYIICDAPAKAFILSVKSHSGYNSCTKCTIHGHHLQGSVCFHDDKNAVPRSDNDYAHPNLDRNRHEFHLGATDLTKLPSLGLVSNVPIDYMHLVCLGVVKKLLGLWIFGDKRTRRRHQLFKIGNFQTNRISKWLVNSKSFIPVEFSRKPRSLKEIKMWKATEYRQILLYSGIIAFKNVLPEICFENFLTLHLGIRILCSPELVTVPLYLQYAKELLDHFVKNFSLLYGKHNVSHNVHGLTHLAQDVDAFGPLDEFSAFAFENEMQILKKKLRKSDKPLQQLCRRYHEEQQRQSSIPKKALHQDHVTVQIDKDSLHYEGPLTHSSINPQYRTVHHKSCKIISKTKANSFCELIDGTIVKIENFANSLELNSPVIIGKEFQHEEKLFEKPCDSTLFGIRAVSRLSNSLKMWNLDEIKCKLFVLPHEDKYVVSPIIHSAGS